jgi:hypothetical protein
MKLSVKVIGTDPPCPRCHRTYELVGVLADELGIDVELKFFGLVPKKEDLREALQDAMSRGGDA